LSPSFFGLVATKKATTIVVVAFIYGFVATKKAMVASCCHLFLFGSIAAKKATTSNYHRLLHFGFVVVKNTTIVAAIAFLCLKKRRR
jgi:hypothetical protein